MPDVSIVYVTHGGWDWLQRSLAALAENTDAAYEVIVVDSASPDDTAERLRGLDGATVVLEDENVGFARACNIGAERASAPLVCFLNVDALVEPGWFEPLAERLAEAGTGAVIPVLLNLDGTIQEAGSAVDSFGWAHALGAGASADALEHRFTRAVDFGSAACMLVERARFLELGGFDRVYGTAYYEDADFCFRLHEHGLRTVLEPRSRVVHARHGASSAEHARQLMLANHDLFFTRWASRLGERPRLTEISANPRHALAARDADALDRILVIDDRVPFTDRGSGDPRMARLLLELRSLWPDARITLAAADPTQAEHYAEPLLREGIEVASEPGRWDRWFADRLFHYGLVIVSRPQNFERFDPYLRQTQPQALRVYDIEAFSSRRLERMELVPRSEEELQAIRLEAARTRQLEAETIERSDALLCVSEEEVALAQQILPGKPAYVVSSYVEPLEDPPGFDEREGLAFFGGFLAGAGGPNEDAVLHLVNDVLPLVWEEHPELALHVIGADATPAVQALESERVRVVGYVEDPLEWLARARVHASPARFGAGIKLKLLDSIAAGLPFVTTPVGAEGLHLDDIADVTVGHSPQELARLISALYSDRQRWETVQAALAELAQARFSRTAFRRSLVDGLSQLGVAPPPPAVLSAA